MSEVQCFDGDGKDPDETGEWDAIDQAYIDYQHRLQGITPEAWEAVWGDLGRLMEIGATADYDQARAVMQKHGMRVRTIDVSKMPASMAESLLEMRKSMDYARQQMQAARQEIEGQAAKLRNAAGRLGKAP